jgi:hypothetical protein
MEINPISTISTAKIPAGCLTSGCLVNFHYAGLIFIFAVSSGDMGVLSQSSIFGAKSKNQVSEIQQRTSGSLEKMDIRFVHGESRLRAASL